MSGSQHLCTCFSFYVSQRTSRPRVDIVALIRSEQNSKFLKKIVKDIGSCWKSQRKTYHDFFRVRTTNIDKNNTIDNFRQRRKQTFIGVYFFRCNIFCFGFILCCHLWILDTLTTHTCSNHIPSSAKVATRREEIFLENAALSKIRRKTKNTTASKASKDKSGLFTISGNSGISVSRQMRRHVRKMTETNLRACAVCESWFRQSRIFKIVLVGKYSFVAV